MFPYFGRKDRIKKLYPAPKNEKIIEPFAGSAPYSLLYWEHDITIADKYEIIIEIWKYLQSASKKDILKLPKIKHWNIICCDYFQIQNEKATWFIDPPYQKEGGAYIHNKINYEYLAKWCKNRKGQVIVCENIEADWLPFKPLNKKFQITQTKKQFKEGIWTN